MKMKMSGYKLHVKDMKLELRKTEYPLKHDEALMPYFYS